MLSEQCSGKRAIYEGGGAMAKYECNLTGDFTGLVLAIENGILSGSASAHLEGSSDYSAEGVKCAVRVFERYSILGKNRVSLSVTVIGRGNQLFLSAITSGGSQAVLFKVNTFGESAFLDCLIDIVKKYKH